MLQSMFLDGWHFDCLGLERANQINGLDACELYGSFPEVQRLDPGSFVLNFSGVAKFAVSFADKSVVAFDLTSETSKKSISHLLLDHVVPRIIAHEGKFVLHASAVDLGGRVAIFLGHSGAGKSTLGASLHAAGFSLLGDDAVVIAKSQATFCAQAVYSSLRLYPDAIVAVLGGGVNTSEMAHYSNKRRVELAASEIQATAPLPIGAIFFLARETSVEAHALPVTPMQSCMMLIEQSFALDPRDGYQASNRMAQASAMASSLPSFKLFYPRDFNLISEVHRVILDCFATASLTSPT